MSKYNVLFVCLGNICRSPMAEAMARKYGSDVLEVSSAGLTPALSNHVLTRTVLSEVNIDLGQHLPRPFAGLDLSQYDLIVNLSGMTLPGVGGVPVEVWDVKDPYGRDEKEFRRARGELEMKVMHLILRARTGKLAKKVPQRIDGARVSSRQ